MNDQFLTQYWPICNGTMLDEIGSSHMTQGNLTSFTSDRFGNLNSALALNGGWTQVPSGVYFNLPQFTISVWIYPQSIGYHARIIDFGIGRTHNIILTFDSYVSICLMSNCYSASTSLVNINAWQFLAVTYNGNDASIYLNGKLVAKASFNFGLQTLTRTNCYIGKSNWPEDGYSFSYIDDLRFYYKSLNQKEIISLMMMNQTQTSKYTSFKNK